MNLAAEFVVGYLYGFSTRLGKGVKWEDSLTEKKNVLKLQNSEKQSR